MINSKKKGNAYEVKLMNDFKELGFTDCATSRNVSKVRDNQKVDLVNTGKWNVQAKCTKNKPDYISILKEMPKEQGQINVIINKLTNKGELVVMSKKDFYKIIENGLR